MTTAALLRQIEGTKIGALVLAPFRRFWRWRWAIRGFRLRAEIICSSPDFSRLPRVPDAGQVRHGCQVMHNGVLVATGSYYGRGSIGLLRRTRGVHEPQEEVAFAEVLGFLPPGAAMLELGSYWAFYSLWFSRRVHGARCHLVEPNAANLAAGRRNFSLNGLTPASATQAYVDQCAGRAPDGIRIVNVPGIVAEARIDHLHLLHADIQGAEYRMLTGAAPLIRSGFIDHFFISTHGDHTHASCRELLLDHGLLLLTDVPPVRSYSEDGVLVACRPQVPHPGPISVSLREPDHPPAAF